MVIKLDMEVAAYCSKNSRPLQFSGFNKYSIKYSKSYLKNRDSRKVARYNILHKILNLPAADN